MYTTEHIFVTEL